MPDGLLPVREPLRLEERFDWGIAQVTTASSIASETNTNNTSSVLSSTSIGAWLGAAMAILTAITTIVLKQLRSILS